MRDYGGLQRPAQTDAEAANSAKPDTERLPAPNDPGWNDYLDFLENQPPYGCSECGCGGECYDERLDKRGEQIGWRLVCGCDCECHR
jgi:hypothetical protein